MSGRFAAGTAGVFGSNPSRFAYVTKNEYVFQSVRSRRLMSSVGAAPQYTSACGSWRAYSHRITSAPTSSQDSPRSSMFVPVLWNSSPGPRGPSRAIRSSDTAPFR